MNTRIITYIALAAFIALTLICGAFLFRGYEQGKIGALKVEINDLGAQIDTLKAKIQLRDKSITQDSARISVIEVTAVQLLTDRDRLQQSVIKIKLKNEKDLNDFRNANIADRRALFTKLINDTTAR